jgi:hypothetical protein
MKGYIDKNKTIEKYGVGDSLAREEGRCLLHCCDDGLLQYKEEEKSYEANIPMV